MHFFHFTPYVCIVRHTYGILRLCFYFLHMKLGRELKLFHIFSSKILLHPNEKPKLTNCGIISVNFIFTRPTNAPFFFVLLPLSLFSYRLFLFIVCFLLENLVNKNRPQTKRPDLFIPYLRR
jgi:hypothetical protein